MSFITQSICRACSAGPSRSTRAIVGFVRPSSTSLHAARSLSTSSPVLSGSNRWSKIKHKKGAADAERSTRLNKLCQDIYRALRTSSSTDPTVNSRLATALAKAKEGGATKAHIENAFARAKSVAEGTGKDMVYEAMGPAGREALIIQCVSDNPNRTIQGINKALDKHKFRIAPVSFMFEKKGLIVVDPSKSTKSFDELFDVALEGGAEDVKEAEGDDGAEWEVYTPLPELGTLTSTLSSPPHSENFSVVSSELVYVPQDPLDVTEDGMGITEEQAESIIKTAELLEEEGDVVKVWTNLA